MTWIIWVVLGVFLGIVAIIAAGFFLDRRERELFDARLTHHVDGERWTCKSCGAVFRSQALKGVADAHDCIANLRFQLNELERKYHASSLYARVEKLESWHPKDALQRVRLDEIEKELKAFNGSLATQRIDALERVESRHRERLEAIETWSLRNEKIMDRVVDLEHEISQLKARRKR